MITQTSVQTQTTAPVKFYRSLSNRVFFGLILLSSIVAVLAFFLPQGESVDLMRGAAPLPAQPWVVASVQGLMILVLYGGLGALGMFLSRRLGLPDLIDPSVSSRQRFLVPALVGAGLGLFLIAADLLFAPINGVGHLIHPPFPTSLVASFLAGINEEILFRLFFVNFWTWVVARLILRGRGQNVVFWVVAVLSALAFAAGHLPAAMLLTNTSSIEQLPALFVAELGLLNSAIGIAAAYFLKKSGYLAAAGVHFWADIIWHVIYGLFV